MAGTALYWDERCFWHTGHGYTFTALTGGLVQPLAAGGTPEDPETKRRLMNLIRVTGLADDLHLTSADPATRDDLLRVHPASYLDTFKSLSDEHGGEITYAARASFGNGSYEIASLSAGLVKTALLETLNGTHTNAYALARPPGHHCTSDTPQGFCLLSNISIAIRAAQAAHPDLKIAVVDWDVHHGNGTEEIFLDDPSVLTISVHQEHNYPWDTGGIEVTGKDNSNMNIPLPPGAGHATYLEAMDRLIVPKLHAFNPDVIIIACGFDASGVDPLSRTIAGSNTFQSMTQSVMEAAATLCDGKLVMAHEGGYSEVHVPFCGHAVLQTMSGSAITAEDPMGPRMAAQQPNEEMVAYVSQMLTGFVEHFNLQPVAKT